MEKQFKEKINEIYDFDKIKEKITPYIIDIYGEKHADVIKERLNNTTFIPFVTDVYNLNIDKYNNISDKDKEKFNSWIKDSQIEYEEQVKQIEQDALEEYEDNINTEVRKYVGKIHGREKESKDVKYFVTPFDKDKEEKYILSNQSKLDSPSKMDYFYGELSEKLLDKNIPKYNKKYIIDKIEEVYSGLGINVNRDMIAKHPTYKLPNHLLFSKEDVSNFKRCKDVPFYARDLNISVYKRKLNSRFNVSTELWKNANYNWKNYTQDEREQISNMNSAIEEVIEDKCSGIHSSFKDSKGNLKRNVVVDISRGDSLNLFRTIAHELDHASTLNDFGIGMDSLNELTTTRNSNRVVDNMLKNKEKIIDIEYENERDDCAYNDYEPVIGGFCTACQKRINEAKVSKKGLKKFKNEIPQKELRDLCEFAEEYKENKDPDKTFDNKYFVQIMDLNEKLNREMIFDKLNDFLFARFGGKHAKSFDIRDVKEKFKTFNLANLTEKIKYTPKHGNIGLFADLKNKIGQTLANNNLGEVVGQHAYKAKHLETDFFDKLIGYTKKEVNDDQIIKSANMVQEDAKREISRNEKEVQDINER